MANGIGPYPDNYPASQNTNSNSNHNNYPSIPHANTNDSSIATSTIPRSYHNNTYKIYGCKHYARKCWLRAECCNEWFVCRLCHDETNETIVNHKQNRNSNSNPMLYKPHKMNRYTTAYVKCMQCGTEQRASKYCTHCSIHYAPHVQTNLIAIDLNKKDKEEKDEEDEDIDLDIATHNMMDTRYCFAQYYCDICKFYDDKQGKPIFHCVDCGLCRLGTSENFIHCKKCGCCLHVEYYAKHPCIENSLKSDCPICFAYLFTSREPVTFFKACGHPLHYSCLMKYFEVGNWQCPICRTAWNDTNQLNDTSTTTAMDASEN